jgi:DNA-binding NtrC family response regulator
MASNLIVMPGTRRINFSVLQAVAGNFGWMVGSSSDTGEVTASEPVAALVSRDALAPGQTWAETLRQLRLALPGIRLITCHGFSDPIDWQELSEAGAFHAIHVPLKENELRQALGFVWKAERRRGDSIERLPVAGAILQAALPVPVLTARR